MPWGAADAVKHTKKARGAKAKRQWAHVANSMLASGHSEGVAVRAANARLKANSTMAGSTKVKDRSRVMAKIVRRRERQLRGP